MSRSIRASLFAVVALAVGASAASATTVTGLNGSSSWGYVAGDDVKSGGSASIVASPTTDGDGSLQITTNSSIAGSSNAKAYAGTSANFGAFSDLSAASFQYMVDAGNTTPGYSSPAFKLFLNNGTQSASLTWEYAYNGTGSVPSGWQTVDLTTQQFWLRFSGTNYDIPAQMSTLADWSSNPNTHGFNFANAMVTGIQIGFGSGVDGQFTAYADDVQLAFSGGGSYSYNFAAVPTPASFAGGALLLGGLAVASFRRKAVTA